MRVAIVHYHLRPGGVTRVIQNAIDACAAHDVQHVVLAGETPSSSMPVSHSVVIDALGYADTPPQRSIAEIVDAMQTAAIQALGARPDVWHVHNHALGKNLVMSELVYYLASQGERLVLQPHDFAEDGRPANYRLLYEQLCPKAPEELGRRLYPQGRHVHYALINQRDLSFLRAAGVADTQLHALPNAVDTDDSGENAASDVCDSPQRRLFLYPIRAIRRKNIGEFLFWAAFAEEGDLFAITRAPKNPRARPIYDDWVRFANDLRLPVAFEFGKRRQGNFNSMLCAAHALVSTSVAEGFGLAFLEPWLADRPLIGRDLPEITDMFHDAGIELGHLYARLEVPLNWIDKTRFERTMTEQLRRVYAAYGRKIDANDIKIALSAAIHADTVDFGRLNEALQQQVIRHLAASETARQEISPQTLMPEGLSQTLVGHNRQAVRDHFNLNTYGARLMDIYRAAANSPSDPLDAINAQRLLDLFLAPQRFSLLRT